MKLKTIIGNNRPHRTQAFRDIREEYLKDLENWLLRQYRGGHGNLNGLTILLADGVIDLGPVDYPELRKHPGILAVIRAVLRYTRKMYHEMDNRLNKMHKGFERDLEDMNMQILKKEGTFNHYMQILAQAEETRQLDNQLHRLFGKIAWPGKTERSLGHYPNVIHNKNSQKDKAVSN